MAGIRSRGLDCRSDRATSRAAWTTHQPQSCHIARRTGVTRSAIFFFFLITSSKDCVRFMSVCLRIFMLMFTVFMLSPLAMSLFASLSHSHRIPIPDSSFSPHFYFSNFSLQAAARILPLSLKRRNLDEVAGVFHVKVVHPSPSYSCLSS